MTKAITKSTFQSEHTVGSPQRSGGAQRASAGSAMFPLAEKSSDFAETIEQTNDRISARFPETLKKLGE